MQIRAENKFKQLDLAQTTAGQIAQKVRLVLVEWVFKFFLRTLIMPVHGTEENEMEPSTWLQ